MKEPQHSSVVWCNSLYNSKHSNNTGLFGKGIQKEFCKMLPFYFLLNTDKLIFEGHKNNSDDSKAQFFCALIEILQLPDGHHLKKNCNYYNCKTLSEGSFILRAFPVL